MQWFYLSFVDATRPKGQRFNGCCILQAETALDALPQAWKHKINPGGEAMIVPMIGEPPAEKTYKLFRTRDEARAALGPEIDKEGP